MGDVNLEIKLGNLDERVIKIEESGGGSGGDGYITSVSNDFNVVNKKLSLSNDITAKLSKVDTPDNLSVELAKKIDKPASATNGQVLTYNGTSNEWEAQDSKGGDDDTSIISDAYDELKTYVAGEYCIYNNLLWKCLVQNNGQTPTEGTYWTKVTVANEITSVNNSLGDIGEFGNYEVIVSGITTVGNKSFNKNINNYRYIMYSTMYENNVIRGVTIVPVDMFINGNIIFTADCVAPGTYYANVKYVDNNTINISECRANEGRNFCLYGIK